jgi:tetratricopeptide (TPR) repeat protein
MMLMTMVFALAMAGTDPDLTALVPRIEHAVVVGSVPALEQCRDSLLAGVKDTGRPDINMVRYTLAYVDWRLFPLLDAAPATQQRGSARLEEAEQQLLEVIKAEPQNAEALALQSTVYGQMIGTSMWKGITLGPKSSAAIGKALNLAGANPRVVLMSGVGAFFTPKMLGGGADKAEKELKRADALFSTESATKAWPNWGRLDVLAWLGQVLASRGNREGARALYTQALAAQPDFAWVKYVLMPALDSQSRKK